MPEIICYCAGCSIKIHKVFDHMLMPSGKVQFFCDQCEKKREDQATFSNLIGNTPSVAFLKRLKA